MPRNAPMQKYVVCNSDESEPGTCHDRDILRYNPHSLIEGMAIGGYAMNCHGRLQLHPRRVPRRAGAALRGGARRRPTRRACSARTSSARGIDFDLHTFVGAGAYICGEETALLDSLEGKTGKPRFKPPFPADLRPVRHADHHQQHPELRLGADDPAQGARQWFADLGPKNSGGTVIFSVSGHVDKPGNFEVPLGMPFAELLELAGGVRGRAASSRP